MSLTWPTPFQRRRLSVEVGEKYSGRPSLIHIGQRRRWSEREARLIAENHQLRIRNDRSDILLAAEPQIVVAWSGRGGEPDIEGDLSIVSDGMAPRRVLGFGSWLPPAEAQTLDAAVERLKERGEPFRTSLRTTGGRVVEAEGRPVLGRAVLRHPWAIQRAGRGRDRQAWRLGLDVARWTFAARHRPGRGVGIVFLDIHHGG